MIDSTLPLIDLHRHLDGNIRPSTIWELAQKNNIALPTDRFEQFLPFVQIQKSEPDLLAFLKKLDWGVAVLKTLDDCRQVAHENVVDAFNAGLHYTELRFSPYYMSMNHNLPIEGVVEAVIDGVNSGSKEYNVKTNLIGILSRTFGVECCQAELNGLLAHKESLVAVDLAGDEFNKPGELFVEHFRQVTDANLHVTIHAGEAAGPESIWQAIKELKADRIGHGVVSYQDQALLDYMREHNIAIESCLTSNFQTGTVKDLSKHPIKIFLENGLRVCLNTDDPAVEGIELKHEFELAQSLLHLTDQDISQLQRNAVDASFLSDSEKQRLLQLNTL
ncbi:adenosine deaminase [Colwelliaceae bacterium 6471]